MLKLFSRKKGIRERAFQLQLTFPAHAKLRLYISITLPTPPPTYFLGYSNSIFDLN